MGAPLAKNGRSGRQNGSVVKLHVASRHPYTAAAVGAGILVTAVAAVVTTPLLGAVGFGAAGVATGLAVAAVHPAIGSVASGSVFATLQSAAVDAVVQAAGAGMAALSAVWAWATSRDE